MTAALRVSEVPRLVRTASHLRPSQIWHRFRLRAYRKFVEAFADRVSAGYHRRASTFELIRFDDPGLARVAALRLALRSTEERLSTAADAVDGRFRFLNRTEEFGAQVGWHHPSLHTGTRLWKTYLHEFSFAVDLAAAHRETGDPRYRTSLFGLIESWHRDSPLGHRDFALDSWNARAVTTRMINWLVAGSLLQLAPDSREARVLSRAVAVHALFLRDHLELDLLGNHLLRDAVGLVFAHHLLGGFPTGPGLLRRQLVEQVLADGSHCERTPLYHAVVLQDLLETRELLQEAAPPWLCSAVDRMTGFLRHLVGETARLPLMGDSWLGGLDLDRLLEALPIDAAEPAAPERHSGLVVLSRGETRAILRGGAAGPDYQMGHAHADLLSFEATHAGVRIVADSGGALYAPGPERQRLRSTAAHNTVCVDDQEQLEAWGSFRVGRRGKATVVHMGRSGEASWCWARHDGYRWLAGRPTHQRLLIVGDGMVLALDAVTGARRHKLASYLHLNPEADQLTVKLLTLGGVSSRRTVALYEQFNRPQLMAEAFREEEAELPWTAGWLVLIGERWRGSASASLEDEPGGVRVRYDEGDAFLEARWRYDEPHIAPQVTLRSSRGLGRV